MVTNALASFSLSAWVAGSMLMLITGSGKVHALKDDRSSGSQSVSPVIEFLRPTSATICPAMACSRAMRSLACISKMRLTISRLPLLALRTRDALFERARVDPRVGQVAVAGRRRP